MVISLQLILDTFLQNKGEIIISNLKIKYTIKDGVVYNSKKLLKEVKEMVDLAKKEAGFKIKQPGLN